MVCYEDKVSGLIARWSWPYFSLVRRLLGLIWPWRDRRESQGSRESLNTERLRQKKILEMRREKRFVAQRGQADLNFAQNWLDLTLRLQEEWNARTEKYIESCCFGLQANRQVRASVNKYRSFWQQKQFHDRCKTGWPDTSVSICWFRLTTATQKSNHIPA